MRYPATTGLVVSRGVRDAASVALDTKRCGREPFSASESRARPLSVVPSTAARRGKGEQILESGVCVGIPPRAVSLGDLTEVAEVPT